MRGSTRALLLGVVVLATPLAGCLADTQGGVPAIPYPQPGDTYVYLGDDGSQLNVTIGGVHERLAGDLSVHHTVLVNWTFTEPDGDPWRFQEALLAGNGTIVQQVAFCSLREINSETAEASCYDDRRLVGFVGAGLPGAFGVGPWWGTTPEPPASSRNFTHPLGGEDPLSRTIRSSGPGCWTITTEDANATPSPPRALRFTVGTGDVVVCRGQALPQRFDPVRGPSFELVTANRSPPRDSPGDVKDEAGHGPGVATRRVGLPLMVEDPTERLPLTTAEAHREALSRSQPYREAFEERGGVLVHSHYNLGGSASTANTVSSERHERRLILHDETLRLVDVSIQKTERDPGPATYALIDEQTRSIERPPPMAARIVDRQPSVQATRELGEAFAGTSLARGLAVQASTFLKSKARLGSNDVSLRKGYVIVAWHDEPGSEGDRTQSGLAVQLPYETVVHGPTASLLWTEVAPDRFPLEAAPGDGSGGSGTREASAVSVSGGPLAVDGGIP